MNEISSVLESKEKVLWEGKPRYSAYLFSFIIGGLIFCIILGLLIYFSNFSLLPKLWDYIIISTIFILVLVYGQLSYKVTHYVITNKRVIIQSGIIGRDFKSIEYDRIQNASVKVGIIGLIFKVGTIEIFTGEMETINSGNRSSTQAKYDKIIYIPNAYDTLKILQSNLSNRKETLYSGRA